MSTKNNSWKRAFPLLRLGTEQQICEVCPGPADAVGPTWTLTLKSQICGNVLFCGWCTRGWKSEMNTSDTAFQKVAPVRVPQLGEKGLQRQNEASQPRSAQQKTYFRTFFKHFFCTLVSTFCQPPPKKDNMFLVL